MARTVHGPSRSRTVRRAGASLPTRLCRAVAEVRRCGYAHDVEQLMSAVGVLRALTRAPELKSLAWHARMIHELRLEELTELPRLYDLLDGLEFTLETTLAALSERRDRRTATDVLH